MLNSTTDQATYAYGTLLTTDRLASLCLSGPQKVPTTSSSLVALCQNAVTDTVGHPMEPLAVRLTLAGPIDKIDVPAMADELKHAIPEYRAPAANYDWTGFYVGAHVSNRSTKTTASTVDTATGASLVPDGLTPSNWSGGLQVGYDYMMPSRVVVGVTGDVSSGGRKAALTADGSSANELNAFDSESVRARLGFAADNVLLYGTAGWAWSSNQYVRTQLAGELNLATTGTAEATNRYLSGWTAGGGLAYAFAQNWNVFAEYRHTSYGSADFALPFSQLFTTTKTEVNAIDFGVNYKFDAGSAPVHRDRVFTAQPASLAYKTPSAGHAFNWTGFNVGIDGGYGWGDTTGTLTDATGTPLTPYGYKTQGPFAGLIVGGDYQINRFVIGAEGDWQWGNLAGNNQANAAAGAGPGGANVVNTMIKDYGSVRGRFGVVALDRFMLFGTAGWAWGNPSNIYYGAAGPVASPSLTSTGFTSGWTAGAGLDYAVTDSVFARLEYRHTNLEAPKFADLASNFGDATSKVPVNDFRAGLVYKFRDIPFLSR
jgi:outer membrane immunogenic protein